jgi:LuxR family maltose regulon positive regulatory protein
MELTDTLVEGALFNHYLPFAIETLLLRAQMHAALGQVEASQADFSQALKLGQPEGMISIFVEAGRPIAAMLSSLLAENQPADLDPDYLQRILTAYPESPASRGLAGLTERELDVLRLMAEGLKYAEIAEQLVVSINTVRSHVKAIYSKLGVNNRTKAIAIAQEQALI